MFGLVKYLVCFILGLQLACSDNIQPIYQSNLNGLDPIYDSLRCKQHELLYPYQANNWICDCEPAALYYPKTDACYPAFRKGPCAEGEFLVLYSNAVLPICIANDCRVDGQVIIKGLCYEFGVAGPCKDIEPSSVIGVDPKTLKVICLKVYYADNCARGSKRAIQGLCQVGS